MCIYVCVCVCEYYRLYYALSSCVVKLTFCAIKDLCLI